jgi:hypothetical protein
MAKAAKTRSAKSKTTKSKTTKSKAAASKTGKRVAAPARKGGRPRASATPIVCVVTPTNPTTKSIAAFCQRLMAGRLNFILQIYSAANSSANLDAAAAAAAGANPKAILACGRMALDKVLSKSLPAGCKVVMVGGDAPQNPPANLTGFEIKGQATAQYHLQQLRGNHTDITVLLDPTNAPSLEIWNSLLPNPLPQPPNPPVDVQLGPNQWMRPLLISDPSLFQQQNITTDCFMVLPNAMFYEHCADIVAMVDTNNYVKNIYYPEHEYKDASKHNPNKAKVHGHDIQGTFQAAADIVKGILSGASPPPVDEGLPEP